MDNLTQRKDSRVVLGITEVNLYNYCPLKIHKVTDIVGYSFTTNSGNISFSTFIPSGIDIHNSNIGMVGYLDLTTSGVEKLSSFYDFNLRRGDVNISGSKGIGSV